jgi:hypothetical protein
LANAPSGATHFRLDISACSEWFWIQRYHKQSYDPMDADRGKRYSIQCFLLICMLQFLLANCNSNFTWWSSSNSKCYCFAMYWIEFYQQVGGNYYLFVSGNCLKVEDAFRNLLPKIPRQTWGFCLISNLSRLWKAK